MPSITNIILGSALSALQSPQASANQQVRENAQIPLDAQRQMQASQTQAVKISTSLQRSEERQATRRPKHVDASYGPRKQKLDRGGDQVKQKKRELPAEDGSDSQDVDLLA